ncbi:multidrug resistance-associated protein 1-like [Oratosquilla oratoria]|uniref:multidrug resistance-associated protein 1-like n=1 Tax=Oratosquilla oratoria TaxID=337810 RepID=UPI003F774EF6
MSGFETLSRLCGSPFWNASLSWDTDDPVLGPCAERSLLIWVPCAVLWALGLLHLAHLARKSTNPIPWNSLNVTKVITSGVLLVALLVELLYQVVVATHEDHEVHLVFLLAPALLCMTVALQLCLVLAGRVRGERTSGDVWAFWGLLLLCGIPQLKSTLQQLLEGDSPSVPQVVFLVVYAGEVLMFVLNCFADAPGLFERVSDAQNPSPESEASFPGYLMQCWLDSLIWTGWRRPLTPEDLFPLPEAYSSKVLAQGWKRHWSHLSAKRSRNRRTPEEAEEEEGEKDPMNDTKLHNGSDALNGHRHAPSPAPTDTRPSGPKINIIWVLWRMFYGQFLLSAFLFFVSKVFEFMTPMLLSAIISFISRPLEPMWHGVLYAAGLFAVTSVSTLCLNHTFRHYLTISLQIESSVVGAVFEKALRLSSSARRNFTVGEIVNLMAVDAARLSEAIVGFHLSWGGPAIIVIAFYYVSRLLGTAVLASIAVIVVLFPINFFLTNKLRELQSKQMKIKDRRVKLTNEIISGIKVLKMYAWETSFEERISQIRKEEVRCLKKGAVISALAHFFWLTTPYLIALASFTAYILESEENVLDAKTAFVAVSLFNIAQFPLAEIPFVIAQIVMGGISLKRINAFMDSEELSDTAVLRDNKLDAAVRIRDGQFTWGGEAARRPKEGQTKSQKSAKKKQKMKQQEGAPEELESLQEDGTGDGGGPAEQVRAEPWRLSGVDVQLPAGSLTAVVGSVGSGKSSLVAAMLGEMTAERGSVVFNGRVAYVAQQAWLQNATLQENITWGRSMDQARYQEIIDACALQPDIDVLPGGDQVEIGEKGINLSGGQKQRVALARAAYSGADILLLDDPLSAVDSHVAKHIFDRVVGPAGLLKGKTRVLVTNAVTFLPKMDHVIVLQEGRLVEQGTYSQLIARGGDFAQFLIQHLKDDGNDDEELEEMVEQLQGCTGGDQLIRQLSSPGEDEAAHEGSKDISSPAQQRTRRRVRTKSETSQVSGKEAPAAAVPDNAENANLIEEETYQHGKMPWKVYGFYARAVGVLWLIAPMTLFVLAQSSKAGANTWLSVWTSQEFVNGTPQAWSREAFIGGYAGFGVGQTVSCFFGTVATTFGAMAAAVGLHQRLLDSVLKFAMSFFDTNPTGRIMNRFTKDVDVIDRLMPENIKAFGICIMDVAFTFIVVTASTPMVAVVLVPIFVLYYFIQVVFVDSARQIVRLKSVAKSPVLSHISETVQGATTVRAFGRQRDFIRESASRVDRTQTAAYLDRVAQCWLGIRLQVIGNGIVFAAALMGVFSRETISPGMVGLSITYALSVTMALAWFIQISSRIQTNIVSVERIMDYIQKEKESPRTIAETAPPPSWPAHGGVSLCGYQLRYRPGLELVLKGLTLEIHPQEKVGIVGRTGAGKSSLTMALFRIIEAAGGTISIDGVDVAKLGLHQLRSRLTIIPQDPVLFSGTLRDNLDPFGHYSDEEIWRSLEFAHLASYARTLAHGLTTTVEESGSNLSVGQRQLLCLARALLRKTRILVLDEATAAVDLETDDLIQTTIRREFREATVLTIAHRLNTIMDSDRVLVLNNGMVVEFDSPSNLLKIKKGVFRGMAEDAGLV